MWQVQESVQATRSGPDGWRYIAGFGRFGPDVVDHLHLALQDESKWVRLVATDVLGGLRDPRSVDPLIAGLDDTDNDVRLASVKALEKIGSERAACALEALSSRDRTILGKTAREAYSHLSSLHGFSNK